MSNQTLFMEGEYNLTSIIDSNIIDSPETWLYNWNVQMGGWAIFALLIVFMIILFFAMRKNDNIKDSESAAYAGYITSIVALFLIIINIDGNHLLEWSQVLTIWIITGIAFLVDKVNGDF